MNKILLRRSVFNLRMLIVVVIVSMIYFLELYVNEGFFIIDWSSTPRNTDILSLLLVAFTLSVMPTTAGIFPGIPYSFSLLEERNCGFIRYELQRMSVMQYIWRKVFFSGIAGACSMLFPYIILMFSICLVGTPVSESIHPNIMELQIWGDILYIWGGFLVLLLKGLLLTLFGILWAELSLFISLFIRNRYIAFTIPFLFYQICWLVEIGNGKWRVFNPVYIIDSNFQLSEVMLVQPFMVFTIYITIVCVLCVYVFKEQVKNGYI